MLCNLTVDDTVNLSLFTVNSSFNTSKIVTGFDTGLHNWSILCLDNASNGGTNGTYYFNITPPDVEVSSADISFNTTLFEEGINFTIFANISNIGTIDLRNVIVQFYEGDPEVNGVLLRNDRILDASPIL